MHHGAGHQKIVSELKPRLLLARLRQKEYSSDFSKIKCINGICHTQNQSSIHQITLLICNTGFCYCNDGEKIIHACSIKKVIKVTEDAIFFTNSLLPICNFFHQIGDVKESPLKI